MKMGRMGMVVGNVHLETNTPTNRFIFTTGKIHYDGNIGEEGEQNPNFMYQWVKVLDKDGTPTEHWTDYVNWSKSPLPNTNCCDSWCTCWGCCLSNKERFDDMCRPNPTQIVMSCV